MFLKAMIALAMSFSALAAPTVLQNRSSSSLPNLALQKVLNDAAPVFGHYSKNNTKYSTWMSKYSDSTQIVHSSCPIILLSIPKVFEVASDSENIQDPYLP
jgi:hypothetical protein